MTVSDRGLGIRIGNFAVYQGKEIRIIEKAPDGWVLDLDQPTIVPRDHLDDRFFVRTTAAMHGERVDVTELLDGRVTLRVDGYPDWVADLDAPFDRNDWSSTVTDVPIEMLSDLREYVTHYRS